jgi:hypothetical protein
VANRTVHALNCVGECLIAVTEEVGDRVMEGEPKQRPMDSAVMINRHILGGQGNMTFDGASRHWRESIRDVLSREWDPGGCPESRFDSYVAKIAAMIRSGASVDELANYLKWAETVHMGLPDKRGRRRRVVTAIRAIGRGNYL